MFISKISLYNGCLEIVSINNQTINHFVNICSKEVHANISYPSTVNLIYGYLDARISPTSVKYIILRDKQLNKKEKKRRRIQGGVILRLLQKNNL